MIGMEDSRKSDTLELRELGGLTPWVEGGVGWWVGSGGGLGLLTPWV